MALAFGSDQGEQETRGTLGRITLLLFLLAVALLGLVVLRAYQARTTEVTFQEVPVLQAEAGPTRERPVEPGGMQVPHQDAAVFKDLEGAKEPTVERLLPPPEAPMPRPVAVVVPDETVPLAPAMPPSPAPAETKPSDEAITEAAAAPTDLVAETPPEVSVALSIPDEPPRPKAPATDVAMTSQLPALANPTEGYRVQLGSFRQANKASTAWQQAVATAPELLGPVNHIVFQADLGAGKGVFYRLQAGPLPSRDSADSLCNQLKAKKVDCYVVSP